MDSVVLVLIGLSAQQAFALAAVALWLLPALLASVVAYFLLKRLDGAPVPTLLRALQGRSADERPART